MHISGCTYNSCIYVSMYSCMFIRNYAQNSYMSVYMEVCTVTMYVCMYVYILSIGNTDNVIFPARRALTTKNMSPDQTTHQPAAHRLPCANKSSHGHPLGALPLLPPFPSPNTQTRLVKHDAIQLPAIPFMHATESNGEGRGREEGKGGGGRVKGQVLISSPSPLPPNPSSQTSGHNHTSLS